MGAVFGGTELYLPIEKIMDAHIEGVLLKKISVITNGSNDRYLFSVAEKDEWKSVISLAAASSGGSLLEPLQGLLHHPMASQRRNQRPRQHPCLLPRLHLQHNPLPSRSRRKRKNSLQAPSLRRPQHHQQHRFPQKLPPFNLLRRPQHRLALSQLLPKWRLEEVPPLLLIQAHGHLDKTMNRVSKHLS